MQVKFYGDGLFSLDWETFEVSFLEDRNLDKVDMDIYKMIDVNNLWRDSLEDGIRPVDGNQDIYNWVRDLSRIIVKLREEKVPWKAQSPIFFHYGTDSGIIRLDNDGIVHLVIQKSAGTVTTNVIDLFNIEKSKLL